jgi:hypothetical protein
MICSVTYNDKKVEEGNIKSIVYDDLFSNKSQEDLSSLSKNLLEYLFKINPKFKIQRIKNLPEGGLSYISDFLLKIGDEKAIPEEVAHFFFELLPNGELKRNMLKNISRFSIYQETLKEYREDPEYQKEDGSSDIDKIKSEAIAKLLAAFTKDLYEGKEIDLNKYKNKNFSLIEWFKNFLNFIFKIKKENILKDYLVAVDMILKHDTTLLDLSLAKNKGVFKNKTNTTSAIFSIMSKIKDTNNLKALRTNLNKIRSELWKKSEEIKQSKLRTKIEKALQDTNNISLTQLIDKINRTPNTEHVDETIELHSLTYSFSEFIESLEKYEKLYKAIEYILQNDDLSDNYVDNINELQQFRKMYQNILTFFDTSLATLFKDANISVAESSKILNIPNNFRYLDNLILSKIKDNLKLYFLEHFKDINDASLEGIEKEIKLLEKDPSNNAKVIEKRKELLAKVTVSDSFISDLLNGVGTDMTNMSNFSYHIMAAVKNGDIFISKIANDIANKRKENELSTSRIFGTFIKKVEHLIENLGNKGFDVYNIGKKLTQIEERIDRTIKKGSRKIIKFINPHINIEYTLNTLRKERDNAYQMYKEKNTKETKDIYHQKRNAYIDFKHKYFNSKYQGKYKDFKHKWEKNNLFFEIYTEYINLKNSISLIEKQIKLSNYEDNGLKNQLLILKQQIQGFLSEEDKVGEDLEKTKLLKQYFKENAEFKEIDINKTKKNVQDKVNLKQNQLESILQSIFNETYNKQVSLKTLMVKLKSEIYIPYDLEYVIRHYKFDSNLFEHEDYDFSEEMYAILKKEFDKDVILKEDDIEFIVKYMTNHYKDSLQKEVSNDLYYKEIIEEVLIPEIERLSKDNAYTKLLLEIRKKRNALLNVSKNELGEYEIDKLPEKEMQKLIMYEKILMTARFPNYTSELEHYYSNSFEDYSPNENGLTTYLQELIDVIEIEENTEKFNYSLKNLQDKLFIAKSIFEDHYLEISEEEKSKLESLNELFIDIFGDNEKSITNRYYNNEYWDKMLLFAQSLDEEFANYNITILENNVFPDAFHLLKEFYAAIEYRDIIKLKVLLNNPYIMGYLTNPEFAGNNKMKKWFLDNHIQKEATLNLEETLIKIDTFIPLNFHTTILPKNSKYSTIKYSSEVLETKVKEQYLSNKIDYTNTSDEEKWTVNNRGEWLPYTKTQLQQIYGNNWEQYKTYLNEDFYKMKEDTDLYQLWKESIKYYLHKQEQIDYNRKSWYDYPIIHQDAYESKKRIFTNLPDVIKEKIDKITKASSFYKKEEKEQYKGQNELEGFAKKRDFDFEGVAFEDDPIALGMFSKTPIERVSLNIFNSLFGYSLEAADYEARKELNIILAPLIEIMQNATLLNHKGQNKRLETLKKLQSQNIYKDIPNNLFNSPFARRIVHFILKFSGMKLLMDGVGGLTNFIQASSNNITEAMAGKHLTMQSYLKGVSKASIASMYLTADYGKSKNLSIWAHAARTWDILQGEMIDDYGERLSIKGKLFNIGKFLMIPRTATEINAQLSMGFGIMEHTPKVKNTIDGKEYSILEMYEVKNDEYRLKEGFPKEWEVGEKKFLELKNKIQIINLELHGNYAKFNQTELSRYGIGLLVENMKRWYTLAISRRWALNETFDPTLKTFTEGYYVTALKALYQVIGSALNFREQSVKSTIDFYMQTDYKRQNLIRTGIDLSIAFMLFLFYTMVMGWDDDDEDKFKKLKEKDYFSQLLLVLALKSGAEQTFAIPLPMYGLPEMKNSILTPVSLANDVVGNLTALGQLSIYHIGEMLGGNFDKKLYYQKNTGALYGDKGDPKIYRFIAKMFGYSGINTEPDYWLKNWVNRQNRLK